MTDIELLSPDYSTLMAYVKDEPLKTLKMLIVIAALVLNVMAQNAPPSTQANSLSTPTLEDGTPVKLRIGRTISSADARTGDTVDFEVLEEVRIGDTLVIPKGGLALATVTNAEAKRRMGRGGKLDINIDHVRLVDGEKAALRAVKEMKGGGHAGAMTGAIVATSLVLWPAAPLFLLMHGKDITIPKGTEITAYINGNMPLDLTKFQPAPTGSVTANASGNAGQSNATEELNIVSVPNAAEVSIDGNFVGNTPALVTVSSGEHVVSVQLSGYQLWQRKLQTSTGKVTISAMLQAGTAVTPAVQSKSSSTPAVTPIAAQATTVISCNTSDCVDLGSAAKKAKAAKQAQSNSTQTPQQ